MVPHTCVCVGSLSSNLSHFLLGSSRLPHEKQFSPAPPPEDGLGRFASCVGCCGCGLDCGLGLGLEVVLYEEWIDVNGF